MYYELKLKVNKTNDKGEEKEVTEQYITDDELFGHVELKGNELYNGNCDVFAISRSKIREIVNEKQADEFFYKITLVEVFVDDNGKEKENKYYVLISAKKMDDANKKAAEYMKQGHSMVVFPEGTRNQTDTLLPFREGGYKMAEKSKSPIVPVSICRSDLMLESAPKKRIHSHSVTIEFGKPIYPCELPPKERKERYAEFPQLIQDMYDKNNI